MDDLISRRAAIDTLGEEPEVWSENDDYALGLNNQWHYDVYALKAVPSAQTGSDLERRRKHYEEAYNQGFVDGCKLYERQPERKKGKWIDPAANDVYRCSVCEEYTKLEVPGLFYHYCPNCGAQMNEIDITKMRVKIENLE